MGLLDRFLKPRETVAQRAEWLQNTTRAVVGEMQNRHLADLRHIARRNFETAETTPWTESWSTSEVSINDALSRQLPTLWSRAAGLARNNEWAKSYLIQLADNVLGPNGIQLQMRLKNEAGQQDAAMNTALEKLWADWGEQAEVSGLSWQEVEELVLNTAAKRGEMLIRLMRGHGPFGIQIQLLDPVLIDVNLNRTWQGRRVRLGKEIDDNGRCVAYWLQAARASEDPAPNVAVGKHVRIPAEEIIHRFEVEEVGQLRGIPWLTVGARRLWLNADFEEAAAVASSNAAKRQGFFYTPSGEAPPAFADTIVSSVLDAAKAAGKVLTPEEIQAITASAERFNTLVPGQFDTLPGNTQFQSYESAWPNVDGSSYVKQNIRAWTAARGVSYVTNGNDLEAVNYSSSQVGIVGEREHYKKIQNRLRDWLHRPLFQAVLPYLILAQRGLVIDMTAARAAATWQPRRWTPIDPLKAANANDTNLRLRLTSRRRLILERGEDPDEIAAEVAEEEKLYGPLDAAPPSAQPVAEPDEPSAGEQKASLRLAASRGHFLPTNVHDPEGH